MTFFLRVFGVAALQFSPSLHVSQGGGRTAGLSGSVASSDDLRTFLTERAGVHMSYVDKVLELCDDEMIGSVQNLQTAAELGMLSSLFKPVVALGIQSALVDVGSSRAAPSVVEAAAQLQHMLAADAAPQLAGAAAYACPLAVAPRGLEVEPYWDMLPHLPMNTFKPKRPHVASIASVKRIVGADAPGEVCHVTIDSGGALKYWEGQSLGVKPPGSDPNTGKPNSVRLYSIASSRYGDDGAATSISLCVRRAVYWDEALGREDPTKKGVCSNFLCDARPGDDVSVTGPMGKVMLLPESDPSADLIMVGTGTGVAPYRGFLRRLFAEDTPAANHFAGLAWLFLGVPTSDGLLYDDEWAEIEARHPERFRRTYAISREDTTSDGGKVYVQDRMAEHAQELFDRLDGGAHIYFCGLKGMMPGILTMLQAVAEGKGLVWDQKLEQLKKNGQWHVEVY
jgi:ferredoxin--NADP+ reductase